MLGLFMLGPFVFDPIMRGVRVDVQASQSPWVFSELLRYDSTFHIRMLMYDACCRQAEAVRVFFKRYAYDGEGPDHSDNQPSQDNNDDDDNDDDNDNDDDGDKTEDIEDEYVLISLAELVVNIATLPSLSELRAEVGWARIRAWWGAWGLGRHMHADRSFCCG
jgi:hypothetical protein